MQSVIGGCTSYCVKCALIILVMTIFLFRSCVASCRLNTFSCPVLCPAETCIYIFVFCFFLLIGKGECFITSCSHFNFKCSSFCKSSCCQIKRTIFFDQNSFPLSGCRIFFSIYFYRSNVFNIISKVFFRCILCFYKCRSTSFSIVSSWHCIRIQCKVLLQICINAFLITNGQGIHSLFRIFRKRNGISIYRKSVQAFYRIFCIIVSWKSGNCHSCLSIRKRSIFYRYTCLKFCRNKNIIHRNGVNSLAGIIGNLIDMLSHHALVMCRGGRAAMYLCGKSG